MFKLGLTSLVGRLDERWDGGTDAPADGRAGGRTNEFATGFPLASHVLPLGILGSTAVAEDSGRTTLIMASQAGAETSKLCSASTAPTQSWRPEIVRGTSNLQRGDDRELPLTHSADCQTSFGTTAVAQRVCIAEVCITHRRPKLYEPTLGP